MQSKQPNSFTEVEAILNELGIEAVTEAEIIGTMPLESGYSDRPDRDVGH